MDMNKLHVPMVEKEVIGDLHFPSNEVLGSRISIEERMYILHRATSLGNLDKHKVTIFFEDSEGMKRVRTTIWAITDRKVLLKGGRSIPVSRIHSVKIQ